MPPAYEILLLNTAVPQIQAAQSGDTYVVPRDIAFSAALTLSAGTANGVPYLNGSKVLTTGSALTFDGTNLGVNSPILAARTLSVKGRAAFTATANDSQLAIFSDGSTNGLYSTYNTTGSYLPMTFWISDAEQMRLTSTGLGIGTSSPSAKLDVLGSGDGDVRIRAGSDAALIFSETTANKNWKLKPSAGDFSWQYSATAYNSGYSTLMTLTSSGNLGLGVTPSAWGTVAALQIKNAAFIGFGETAYVSGNAYFDGSWKYIASSGAGRYDVDGGSGGVHRWFTAPSGTAGNAISFTQAMTLDASGNLLVGDTVDTGVGSFIYPSGYIRLNTAGTVLAQLRYSGSSVGTINTDGANIQYNAQAALVFGTNGTTERARITSGGYFKASNTGGYDNVNGTFHELLNNDSGDPVVQVIHFGATSPNGIKLDFTAATPDDNTQYFLRCADSTAARCFIYSDGDLANHDGVYGTISDQKLKQDIVDAGSQWADIKAIRFRKYRMKSDVAANPNAPALLGVVAQELEQVSPGLVDEHPDADGEVTKTVKSSILLMKAAVALQEAMARIETLEAKVAQLEGN